VYPGTEVVQLLDSEAIWEVEPDWSSLSEDLGDWRTRSARLVRRCDAFDAQWKKRTAVAEAFRALGFAKAAGIRASEQSLRLAETVLDPAVAGRDRDDAARRLAELLAHTAEGWDEKSVVTAKKALVYAAAKAALTTVDPVSVTESVEWARRAEGFAVGGQKVSGHSLVKWLLWNDLTEEAKEAVRHRERSTVQSLADELGIDIVSDRPAEPAIQVPARERLPQDRVPTALELTAAAERHAIAYAASRARDLCVFMFNWMLRADPERKGCRVQDIVAGLIAEGVAAEPASLIPLVMTVLDEASAGDDAFEQVDGDRWRIPDGVPGDDWRLNPGHLVKAAAADGWDVIIPGANYDYDEGREPAEEVIILAGPTGPLDPIVRVKLADRSSLNDDRPVSSFFFLVDPADPDFDYGHEIRFDGDLEMGYSGFQLDIVLAERSWGFPDMREPTIGWLSCQGSEVVCAWARPGEAAQGTWEATIDVDSGPEDQRYWVAVAREVAPHA
jgi:hypothetical protein